MKHNISKALFAIALLFAAIALAAGCAVEPTPAQPFAQQRTETETMRVQETVVVEREQTAPQPTPAPTSARGRENGAPGSPPMASPHRANRMIIKNAELTLLMEDVASGIDRTTQVAADTYGYILSLRTWYQNEYQHATITIGVPVDEFENALRRLRAMAIRVQDESASGQDVSDQYVDLESRLRNLQATEARIRAFLDQATDVQESLRVNQELNAITAQIEQIKGQMSYLEDRAAYSTITIHLEPQLPTPTPTPTATPTPTPPPDTWQPDQTFKNASKGLGDILRVIGDLTIWGVVVLGPFALPAAALLWLTIRLSKRRGKPS
jgi:hypothetical protein